ncbi:enoyl-CoA hydratase [Dactylosporangium maewongense]|uniref:Enoyl-CoA hydratase n=1 Tax=Dactylosporangium maewongense TaxID=634393 RepID=A0ABN2DFY2_9ACTN
MVTAQPQRAPGAAIPPRHIGAGSNSPIRCTRAGRIAVVTLDNPPVNAITVDIARTLGAIAASVASDPDIGALIITAAGGRMFSAGSDIVEFSTMLGPGQAVERKLRPQMRAFSALHDLNKPTIAALNGHCLGGGLEIAVCCDLIVAEEQILIGSPEIKLGLFPSSGGTFRVARRIGPGRAKQLQLLGEPISARTAAEWGLVNEVVPAGRSFDRAMVLAQQFLALSPLAIGLCKFVIDASCDSDDTAMTEISLRASEQAFTSAACASAVEAFLSSRARRDA